MSKVHKIKIKGDTWTYRILLMEEYETLHGNDSDAVCIPFDKYIAFRQDVEIEIKVISHELGHAFWSYLHLENAGEHLNIDALEEISVTFISENNLKILKASLDILKKLNKVEFKKYTEVFKHLKVLEI